MSVESVVDIAVDKLFLAVEQILIAHPQERIDLYRRLYPVLDQVVHKLEGEILLAGSPEREDLQTFVQTAKTYARALATYPADTDAWTEVFDQFSKFLNRHSALIRCFCH